jgi:hypothetical protein
MSYIFNDLYVSDPTNYLPNDLPNDLANDLPGNPLIGTLTECENICSKNNECLGFTYNKNTSPSQEANCYLKKSFNGMVRHNNPTWGSYLKSSTPPLTKYSWNNISNTGSDLPGNPVKGTIEQCEKICDENILCEGIAIPKNHDLSKEQDCYLLKNTLNNFVSPSWGTYLKPGIVDISPISTSAPTSNSGQIASSISSTVEKPKEESQNNNSSKQLSQNKDSSTQSPNMMFISIAIIILLISSSSSLYMNMQ